MGGYRVKTERSTPLKLPRHPEAPKEEHFNEWCKSEKKLGRPLAVDLFSGAGGLGSGIEKAGWTVAVAVDNNKESVKTHLANFRGQAFSLDMSDPEQLSQLINFIKPLGIDLVAGGPPCQPFSRAGRAKIRSLVEQGIWGEHDSRKDLWQSFIDVVLAIKPRAVIMENVPDMALGDDLKVVRKIASLLEENEYCVDYRLIDAWKYGVPQHRRRFILQARNDGISPTWPKERHSKVTVRDAISDLPLLHDTTGARELPHANEPISDLARLLSSNGASDTIYDHMTRPVREDDREAFKLMTSKTLYSDLPERLRRYRSDTFNDKYKRLPWDDVSRTITAHIAKDGYWYIHPSEHRTLTVREAARIQTFPDSFRFSGTRSDAFRQIGNAVPPILGYEIATEIHLKSSCENKIFDVRMIRSKLDSWAQVKRDSYWWLFPGPYMTVENSLIATLLGVNRMKEETAREIMEPLKGCKDLSISSISHINTSNLSASRVASIKKLRMALREFGKEEAIELMIESLSPSKKKFISLLSGNDELIINNHVKDIVSVLGNIFDGNNGLNTDIKLALAQLVSLDSKSSQRMCAILAISLSESKSLVKNI
ncbi:DNA cytosine methyltransferase [Rothia sp. L_38]|uniref:DNA cytosine methyltransferase n=1 Tax=Rothia sp. L_38 TaxID=3422315 RepID=UPI003D6B60DC